MKRLPAFLLAAICLLGLMGCGKKSMNAIISSEPSVSGVVEAVNAGSILLVLDPTDGYPDGSRCTVSLNVENPDSMTEFDVGDHVAVYFDGSIAESDPMQIHTVYAIVLLEPADRTKNEIP